MRKASGQSSALLRRKFFLSPKEMVSCGILFRYIGNGAPKIALDDGIDLHLRCVSGTHGEMRINLADGRFRPPVEMLFH
jgi:hypothetical protein